MGKKILVTGASGFVGSFLVEKGLDLQMSVWAGMRKTSSKRYLKDERITFIELDFLHQENLLKQLGAFKEEFGKWDYVIHCAGVTKCRNKEDFEKTNYIGTRNFVETLQKLDMVPEKFIYISTLSVFGPIHEEDYKPILDSDTPQPNTAYGISKYKSEQFLMSQNDFPYVFFRPTGIYGPREKDYFLMVKSIRNHVDFAVGYKKQLITFVYVKDLVKAVFAAIDRDVTGKCYFLTDGQVYTSRAFSDFIQKELGNPWVLRFKSPLWLLKVISLCAERLAALFGKSSTLNGDKYKIMKQRNWQCDITPAINDLGYVPDYSLERGVKEIVAWYKQEGWI